MFNGVTATGTILSAIAMVVSVLTLFRKRKRTHAAEATTLLFRAMQQTLDRMNGNIKASSHDATFAESWSNFYCTNIGAIKIASNFAFTRILAQK